MLSVSIFATPHFWRGSLMSLSQAEKRWGKEKFEINSFRTGDVKIRSKMVYSLVSDEKKFFGKTVYEIRELLGTPDGFYFSDIFPAYMVERGTTREDESWQIVFLLDRQQKVSKIIIHKNCCS